MFLGFANREDKELSGMDVERVGETIYGVEGRRTLAILDLRKITPVDLCGDAEGVLRHASMLADELKPFGEFEPNIHAFMVAFNCPKVCRIYPKLS